MFAVSLVELRSTTTHNLMTSVTSTEHQELFENVYGRAASITGTKRDVCRDVGGFMTGDGCAIGKYLYSQGIYKIYLRLDYGKPFLGIISSEKAKELSKLSTLSILNKVRYHETNEVYGWCTKSGRIIVNGNTVNNRSNGFNRQRSMSDEDGDIFELKIDCEDRELSIINKRTTDRDVIPVEAYLPWHLFVTVCDTISQVALVTNQEWAKN
jgi:hypothetical protein